MRLTVTALKQHAIAGSLFRPTTLIKAITRLGFVQADPIRAPARAQDLILRHRVKDYRAGDLERRYPRLGLEEDYLYAYGFMPRTTWELLHPRLEQNLTALEKRVLDIVSANKGLHPRDLEQHLGKARVINAWGGYSKATTRALEALHHRGLLRVVRRENGIRLYEPMRHLHDPADSDERLRRIVLLIAAILAPVPERSLRATLRHLRRAAPALEGRHTVLTKLIESGELSSGDLDGLRYVWPAGPLRRHREDGQVRFLAPFDPVVWDRRRFEHLFGWSYRFEAYTPVAKRKLGYYALPLLWKHDVIGWVNVSGGARKPKIKAGFVKSEPKGKEFRIAFDEEVDRLKLFLQERT